MGDHQDMLRWQSVATTAIHDHAAHQKVRELAKLLSLVPAGGIAVEIGCDAGGTLWALRQTKAKRVIGVTKPGGWYGTGRATDAHGAELILGDSHDASTLETLTKTLDGEKVDLLFIDGDHSFVGVSSDFRDYSHLVREGGVIALHDIVHHEPIEVGTLVIEVDVERFWRKLKLSGSPTREVIDEPATWGGIGLVTIS